MRPTTWLLLLALLPSAVLAKPAGGPAKTVSGRVTDAHGKPLAGVSVWAVAEGGYRSIQEGQRPDALTGPDGRFRIPRALLPPGSRLAICSAGFETKTVDPRARKSASLQVALRPGPGTRIAGRVVDQTGRPIAGFRHKTTQTIVIPPRHGEPEPGSRVSGGQSGSESPSGVAAERAVRLGGRKS